MDLERRINILFSSTRQFNCGDEFILFGIINLLKSLDIDFNSILYNRNPDIRNGSRINNAFKSIRETKRIYRGKNWLRSIFNLDFFDNSIKDDSNWKNIDLVVFAGTPEWYGKRVEILYKNIEKYNIPCIYLGIGAGEPDILSKLTDVEKHVLKRTQLIAVRDRNAYELLKEFGAKKITCPSILSAKHEKEIHKVEKVGLIYSSSRVSANNSISIETEKYIKELYNSLMKKYDCEFVCHYIEELDYIDEDYPQGVKYFYSYDAGEYFDIYSRFDMIIGCRVHGIGIAASMGIPGVAINHSIRSGTVEGMKATLLDPVENGISKAIELIDNLAGRIEEASEELKDNKRLTKELYEKELSDFLTKI